MSLIFTKTNYHYKNNITTQRNNRPVTPITGRLQGLFLCPERSILSTKSYFDSNGKKRYRCTFRVTDFNGKRKQVKREGFTRAADAKQYETEFLKKMQGSLSMSFRTFAELYLSDSKKRLKPTTFITKKSMFDKWLIPFFSDTAINAVTPPMVRQWQNKLLSHSPTLSQTYVKSCQNQLVALFNYAEKYYNLAQNPARTAGTIGKSKSGRLDFWTTEEYKKFMSALKPDKRLQMFFELAFYSGCRRGELLALTVADFDGSAISIDKSLATISNGKKIVLPPKTAKSNRIVTLPPKVATHLKEYINSMIEPQPNERLFETLNKDKLLKTIKKTATAAGVKPIRIHDLRHSHASLLIEMGFPPLVIAERLGHESVKTTLEIYSHLYPGKADEIASRLNDLV